MKRDRMIKTSGKLGFLEKLAYSTLYSSTLSIGYLGIIIDSHSTPASEVSHSISLSSGTTIVHHTITARSVSNAQAKRKAGRLTSAGP